MTAAVIASSRWKATRTESPAAHRRLASPDLQRLLRRPLHRPPRRWRPRKSPLQTERTLGAGISRAPGSFALG